MQNIWSSSSILSKKIGEIESHKSIAFEKHPLLDRFVAMRHCSIATTHTQMTQKLQDHEQILDL